VPWITKKAIDRKIEIYGCIIPYSGKESKVSCNLFDHLSKVIDNLIYSKHPKEFFVKINNKIYFVDCYHQPSNKIIEVFGDYWHANPSIYKPGTLLNFPDNIKVLVEDIWKRDKDRLDNIRFAGYEKVLILWERDVVKDFQSSLNKCIEFLNS
jgi:hypothetical protein